MLGVNPSTFGINHGKASNYKQGSPLYLPAQSKGSINEHALSLLDRQQTKPGEKKRVWSRSSMILPQYVGRSFVVHNGKTFISIQISPKMLGHKFGEFASTRQKAFHKKKK